MKTERMAIERDEWYPVYSLCKPEKYHEQSYEVFDIPVEMVRRWEACMKEFDELEEQLERIRDGESPR